MNINFCAKYSSPAVTFSFVSLKVQRQSGLNDVDVGFGEIPWEAMILSNREKKLLCSGAIIAPNAVITAAGCING